MRSCSLLMKQFDPGYRPMRLLRQASNDAYLHLSGFTATMVDLKLSKTIIVLYDHGETNEMYK